MNTTLERFEDKYFIALDGCWLWTAYVNKDGYGQFRFDKKMQLAHRVSYELYVGKFDKDLSLDHLCKKVSCVNPYHLEPVTHAENVRRGNRTLIRCQHGVGFSRCTDGCGFEYQKNWRNDNKERKAIYMRNYYINKKKEGN